MLALLAAGLRLLGLVAWADRLLALHDARREGKEAQRQADMAHAASVLQAELKAANDAPNSREVMEKSLEAGEF